MKVLEEKSDLLHAVIVKVVEDGWEWADTKECEAVFLLEAARCLIHYHGVKEARSTIIIEICSHRLRTRKGVVDSRIVGTVYLHFYLLFG